MKILLTGGGSGGHFYPIIAVIDALSSIIEQEKIIKADIIFMSDHPYDKNLLRIKGARFKKVSSGKIRRYFSPLNITDSFKAAVGALKAIFSVYFDFPDVIFSKGGYASFPAVLAARVFGIPLIIHESDTVPGKVNKWGSYFAKRIAISFPQTADFFPKKRKNNVALTGNPIRKEFFITDKKRALDTGRDFFEMESALPVILIMGGSQGAMKINDNIIDVSEELVKKYQIIHQCGKNNINDCKGRIEIMLKKSPYKHRYKVIPYLNEIEMKMAYGAADLVVSRAGSGSIFEIAASGIPSVLIPLSLAAQDHQRENAYAYARTGAASVIEEKNLAPHLLLSEINRLIGDKIKMEEMQKAAFGFAKPNAAEKIAREIINLALEHAGA